jgi:folate-binding protein YgfZ
LFTNDVEKPGDGSFVYGALLTPKGMIVADGWAAREGTTVWYTVPVAAREAALAIFTRSVPPRLARSTDRTAELTVFRLAGPQALAKAQGAGVAIPAPGRLAQAVLSPATCGVARAGERAPFALQITVPAPAAAAVARLLAAAGVLDAGETGLECARILAGWPRLGAEIDDKTIPQEVRLDELGGISYTKGCYTGQETVSRLHFRGHVNRHLRGLLFDGEPAGRADVIHEGHDVGRVTSVAWVPEPRIAGGGRWIGLGVLRREVEYGAVVRAAERDARVVDLPFALPFTTPA